MDVNARFLNRISFQILLHLDIYKKQTSKNFSIVEATNDIMLYHHLIHELHSQITGMDKFHYLVGTSLNS
jgi:hypothetical protein